MIKKIKNIFLNIDRDVQTFQKKTALSCESGCGQCCLNPRVEASVLEMYPLVEHLSTKQEVEVWHKKAQEASSEGRCIFYSPDVLVSGKGRCQIYPYRPSLCRLYGFSAFTNKEGKRSLVTCSIIKNKEKERIPEINDMINHGCKVPVMKEYSDRLYQVHPVLGCRQMPINLAFQAAAESMSLYSKYRKQAGKKKFPWFTGKLKISIEPAS